MSRLKYFWAVSGVLGNKFNISTPLCGKSNAHTTSPFKISLIKSLCLSALD